MIRFSDRAAIGEVKTTQEGYLVARSRALRVGVQEYLASELGLMDGGTKKVYRPPESVFDKDSLKGLSHAPVTVGHPSEFVTADNYAELAVGEVSTDIMRDGEWIVVTPMIKDKRGLDAVSRGEVELSAGYVADMHPAPEGSPYDFIMGPPKYNHLAIVPRARAGSQARIGDAQTWGAAPLNTKEETKMDLTKIVFGDKAVTVAAADADTLTKMIADKDAALTDMRAELAAVKIECADAMKQIKTPAEIAAMVADGVKELVAVTDKAKALVQDYDATGKDAMTIRREVIKAVYGDEAVADLTTDAEIVAAFKVAKSTAVKTNDAVRQSIATGVVTKDAAQAAYEKRLADAWKGK